MRFIIRADASREIGAGHVMRSLVLAEELISRGFECCFVGDVSDLNWVENKISRLGFSSVFKSDLFFTPDKELDILLIDSYSIPITHPFVSRNNWRLVLSICDAMTPRYESDIELHPGFTAVHSRREHPLILSGKEHILIRKGIEKSERKHGSGKITKVLIVGGGSDFYGFVPAIAEVIGSWGLTLEVHTFTEGIVLEESKAKFVKHSIGPELDLIASDVDLVFTTASTSSLEFIAREVPTGVVCAVDNQADYYEQLGQLGCAAQLGILNADAIWEFDLITIRELLENQEKRSLLKEASRGLIDLKGAARVVDALVSLAWRQGN